MFISSPAKVDTNLVYRFIHKKSYLLKLPKIHQIEVDLLPSGESNLCYRVVVNGRPRFVVRIPQLYEKEIEKEFRVLQKIPSGIGPKAILFDSSKKIVQSSVLVQSFINGTQIQIWNKEMLARFSKTLANLHKKTSRKRIRRLDLVRYADRVARYFFDDKNKLKKDPDIPIIQEKVRSYLNAYQWLIDSNRSNSIIHGDLNPQNILQSQEKIMFIDWELSQVSDPAQDFATFYYDDFRYMNWRILLNQEDRDFLIQEYQKWYGIDSTLKERINVWQIWDKFGAYIYCKWKLLTPSLTTAQQKDFSRTTEQLKTSLLTTLS